MKNKKFLPFAAFGAATEIVQVKPRIFFYTSKRLGKSTDGGSGHTNKGAIASRKRRGF